MAQKSKSTQLFAVNKSPVHDAVTALGLLPPIILIYSMIIGLAIVWSCMLKEIFKGAILKLCAP